MARGRRRKIVILAYDGVQLLDVTGPLEVFATANEMGADYRVSIVSATGDDIVASSGTRVGADLAFTQLPHSIDSLIVPGAVDWRVTVERADIVEFVRGASGRSRRTVSVCAGAFLLAAAGLLDGRRATTHWRFTDDLARHFSNIRVEHDAIFVRDEHVFTSAGVSSGIDLSLALVEADHGAALARAVARHLVVFMQRPGGQTQFSARLTLPVVASEALRGLLDSIIADPAADHRLETLSARAGFSTRHLSRVFRAELGQTPGEFVEAVRVEAAKALLETSASPLPAIAAQSGLGSAETLRRSFLRQLGVTPHAYRQRFRTTHRERGPIEGG